MGSLLNYSARREAAIDLAHGVCVTKTLVCVQNVDLTANGQVGEFRLRHFN
jgi:hypothetical protein